MPREAAERADFARRPFLDRVEVELAVRSDQYADLFRSGHIDSIATTADFLKDPALLARVELCPSLSVQYTGMTRRWPGAWLRSWAGVNEPLKLHCRIGRENTMAHCDLYMMGWIGDTGDPDDFLQPLFHSRLGSDAGNRGRDPERRGRPRCLTSGRRRQVPSGVLACTGGSRRFLWRRLLGSTATFAKLMKASLRSPGFKGDEPRILSMRRFKHVWISRQGNMVEQVAD